MRRVRKYTASDCLLQARKGQDQDSTLLEELSCLPSLSSQTNRERSERIPLLSLEVHAHPEPSSLSKHRDDRSIARSRFWAEKSTRVLWNAFGYQEVTSGLWELEVDEIFLWSHSRLFTLDWRRMLLGTGNWPAISLPAANRKIAESLPFLRHDMFTRLHLDHPFSQASLMQSRSSLAVRLCLTANWAR